jgi:CxxC motif-containing protein
MRQKHEVIEITDDFKKEDEIKVCCTTCPQECVITIHLKKGVLDRMEGEGCKRGKKFAQKEITTPERTLTSTVMVTCGGKASLLPVKTAAPIPKKAMTLAMDVIRKTKLIGPCQMGDVVIANICGTGVDVVACRSIKEQNHAC